MLSASTTAVIASSIFFTLALALSIGLGLGLERRPDPTPTPSATATVTALPGAAKGSFFLGPLSDLYGDPPVDDED